MDKEIDIALAEDALAQLDSVLSLLKRVEECEKSGLNDDLAILLENAISQMMIAGLEPKSDSGALWRFIELLEAK